MKFQIYRENFLYTKIEYNYFNAESKDEKIEVNCKVTPVEQSIKQHIKNSDIIFLGIWEVRLFSSIFSCNLEIECVLKIEKNSDDLEKSLEDIKEKCISESLEFIDEELRKLLDMTPSRVINKIM